VDAGKSTFAAVPSIFFDDKNSTCAYTSYGSVEKNSIISRALLIDKMYLPFVFILRKRPFPIFVLSAFVIVTSSLYNVLIYYDCITYIILLAFLPRSYSWDFTIDNNWVSRHFRFSGSFSGYFISENFSGFFISGDFSSGTGSVVLFWKRIQVTKQSYWCLCIK